MREIRNISIVGMGALGLLYGSHIAQQRGRDSVAYVMDRARADKYRNQVFTVNGKTVDLRILTAEEAAPADLLITAVKYTGLASAFEVMEKCVDDHTIILSVLNGITSEDEIAEHFGRKYMIYTVPQGMDAMKFGGDLRYTQQGALHIGILDEAAKEDFLAVCRFLDEIGLNYVQEKDIRWRMWFKYMLNVGINQVCMACGVPYSGATAPGEAHDILVGAMREVRRIANAKGIGLTEEDVQTCIDIENTLDPMGTPSMGQDRINRKPSEVEMFAGTVIRMGKEHGIPTPYNEWLYRRVKEIEREYV